MCGTGRLAPSLAALAAQVSRHHIETMKAAYVKLRQLADAGAKFVGHGLKKDFEMINLVLPPEQVRRDRWEILGRSRGDRGEIVGR